MEIECGILFCVGLACAISKIKNQFIRRETRSVSRLETKPTFQLNQTYMLVLTLYFSISVITNHAAN
jgi:hypothetical protein